MFCASLQHTGNEATDKFDFANVTFILLLDSRFTNQTSNVLAIQMNRVWECFLLECDTVYEPYGLAQFIISLSHPLIKWNWKKMKLIAVLLLVCASAVCGSGKKHIANLKLSSNSLLILNCYWIILIFPMDNKVFVRKASFTVTLNVVPLVSISSSIIIDPKIEDFTARVKYSWENREYLRCFWVKCFRPMIMVNVIRLRNWNSGIKIHKYQSCSEVETFWSNFVTIFYFKSTKHRNMNNKQQFVFNLLFIYLPDVLGKTWWIIKLLN